MPASTLVAGEDGASEAVVEGGTAVATVPEAVAAREEAKKAGGDGRSYCVAISRDLHVRDRRQNTATSDKIGHAQSNLSARQKWLYLQICRRRFGSDGSDIACCRWDRQRNRHWGKWHGRSWTIVENRWSAKGIAWTQTRARRRTSWNIKRKQRCIRRRKGRKRCSRAGMIIGGRRDTMRLFAVMTRQTRSGGIWPQSKLNVERIPLEFKA